MKLCSTSLAFALLTSILCSALPPKQEHKDRVHEMKLSEKDHEMDGEHNNDYDHDAFLGQEEAKNFDDLSPEESKHRLGVIVDKIDKNRDGFVTEQELQEWIQYVQKKYVNEDTDRNWKDHDLSEDGSLTWDSYRKRTYGYEYDPEEEEDYHDMVKRDERKFQAADEDKDGKLSKKEFAAFLHPEEHDHMKDIVVLETIEDIDKNKDGYISLEEYIADLDDEDDDDDDEDDENLNDWKASETEQFHSFRDRNRDGKMDKDEVRHWIIPDDYDSSEAEAQHLMLKSDANEDGKLSREEILDNYDIFVGSQATDFGEALTRHDEF